MPGRVLVGHGVTEPLRAFRHLSPSQECLVIIDGSSLIVEGVPTGGVPKWKQTMDLLSLDSLAAEPLGQGSLLRIEHGPRPPLLIEFSGLSVEELEAALATAKSLVGRPPLPSPVLLDENGEPVTPTGSEQIQAVPEDELDEVFREGWQRLTDEPRLRGVEAFRMEDDDWPWQVAIWLAEFLREPPLEDEMRAGMAAALAGVEGVTDVAEEDREVWIVAGSPTGQDLVAAAGAVVDRLADRARTHIARLGRDAR